MTTDEDRNLTPHDGPAGTGVRPEPGQALDLGGTSALLHSLHLFAQAIDGLRFKLGQQMQLNPIDITAMIHIYNHPDVRPTDLGRALHMGSSGLTTLADRLIRAGYVRRTPDPHDRRGNRLRLSPAGFHATGWVFDTIGAVFGKAFDPQMSTADAVSLMLELARVIDTVDPAALDRS